MLEDDTGQALQLLSFDFRGPNMHREIFPAPSSLKSFPLQEPPRLITKGSPCSLVVDFGDDRVASL